MGSRERYEELAARLAAALAQERCDEIAYVERLAAELAYWPEWLPRLAFLAAASVRRRERDADPATGRSGLLAMAIHRFLQTHPLVRRELDARIQAPPPPRPALVHAWPIAVLEGTDVLARRLELSDGQLAWLADRRGLERTAPTERLRNYRYHWSPRRSGLERLIESPKARLKEIQRWVLHEILAAVPPHPAAHGFTRGRSVHTHAALHSGAGVVIRLDLRDFFASVTAGRVHGIFATLGYPPAVAAALAGLSTNRVPVSVLAAMAPAPRPGAVTAHHLLRRRLAGPHLPQGAPTSPALANLAAFSLDRRVTGLSARFGMVYSRYADDLTVSGPGLSRRATAALCTRIAEIVRAEGFAVHLDKTMIRSRAQRQLVTGQVVNAGPHTPRDEYDRLRAQLHRLAAAGPVAAIDAEGIRRRDRLRGQIAWVASVTPDRGARLTRMFDAIAWTDPSAPTDRPY